MYEHNRFLFHTGIVPVFSFSCGNSTGIFFFISNRYSAQEFGEVKKLAQRDSNPGPTVDASVIRLLLHHRVKVN